MDCPLHDSLLRVHYKAMLSEDKRVFYDTKVDNDGQPLEFQSGEGLVSCLALLLTVILFSISAREFYC